MAVKPANAGAGEVEPSSLLQMSGTLFFLANDPSNGKQALWSSNGTAGGTSVIADLPGGNYAYIDQLVASNNTLFILVGEQSSSNVPDFDLWESNGTAAGTTDLGSLSQYPDNPTPIGNTIYFTTSDALGSELWYAQSGSTGTSTTGSTGTATTGSTGTSTTGSTSTATTGSGSSSTSGSGSAATSSSNSTPLSDSTSAPKTTTATNPQTTPTAAPVQPPAPTIIGEQPIFARKINKRGRPVGKPVLTGFAIEFSRPMAATTANDGFYQFENMRAKAHGKNSVAHMMPSGSRYRTTRRTTRRPSTSRASSHSRRVAYSW